jgi:hypothetical protein
MNTDTADDRQTQRMAKAGVASPAPAETPAPPAQPLPPKLDRTRELKLYVRERLAWLKAQKRRLALWQWEATRLPRPADRGFDLMHLGRKDQRHWPLALLGGGDTPDAGPVPGERAWMSELPFPGAWCIPRLVSNVVPLDRPLDEFMAAMDSELRRRIRKQLPLCKVVQAQTEEEIDFAERNMLRAYATARRGDGAVQLTRDEVHRVARLGRLDIVYLDGEAVSCNLGSPVVRQGKVYWAALRYGFTEAVFNDRKRWGEINALNNFMLLQWSLSQGYDYYDIGYSVARPDDGLLQWKKRQGGALGRLHNHEYDYLRIPRPHLVGTLWRSPLFAIERGQLVLHLGVPAGEADDEVLKRYRHMGFDGLARVHVHCAAQPGEGLRAGVQKLYQHLKAPPSLHFQVVSTASA